MTYSTVISGFSQAIKLFLEHVADTFGRDDAKDDREVVRAIMSNPDNKKKLMDALDKNIHSSIGVRLENGKLEVIKD